MQPRPRAETRRLDLPRVRVCMRASEGSLHRRWRRGDEDSRRCLKNPARMIFAPRGKRFEVRPEHFRVLRIGAKKGVSEFWMSLFRSITGRHSLAGAAYKPSSNFGQHTRHPGPRQRLIIPSRKPAQPLAVLRPLQVVDAVELETVSGMCGLQLGQHLLHCGVLTEVDVILP